MFAQCISTQSVNTTHDEDILNRRKRCFYKDMKLAIDALKEFNDKLAQLHPEAVWKLKQISG